MAALVDSRDIVEPSREEAGGGAALPGILHRGRWRQMDSARHYIQAGPALSAAAAWAVDPARMSLWRAQALDVSAWFDEI